MNDITALRRHLFQTLDALKDKNNPMDIERAKAVKDVAQTIINGAKVEVDFIRATGSQGTGFIPALGIPEKPQVTATGTGEKIVAGGTTVHKLRG